MLVDSSSEGNFFVLLTISASKISLKQQQTQPCPFAMTCVLSVTDTDRIACEQTFFSEAEPER